MEKAKRSHKKPIIILIIVAALLAAPFVPAVICGVRTAIRHDEFDFVTKWDSGYGPCGDRYRVLECSDDEAKIYIWEPRIWGHILTLEKTDGEWNVTSWDTRWSLVGNADEWVPQYWFHFVYAFGYTQKST